MISIIRFLSHQRNIWSCRSQPWHSPSPTTSSKYNTATFPNLTTSSDSKLRSTTSSAGYAPKLVYGRRTLRITIATLSHRVSADGGVAHPLASRHGPGNAELTTQPVRIRVTAGGKKDNYQEIDRAGTGLLGHSFTPKNFIMLVYHTKIHTLR